MAFSRLLRVLGDTGCVLKGRMVHCKIIKFGFFPDVYTSNQLISLYVKFGRLHDAQSSFDQMSERNLFSWTILVSGYSQMGLAEEALDCFRLMVAEGFNPNHYTYVAAISACANIAAVKTGKEIHGRIYRTEQDLNSFMSNCLVNLYAKCGLPNSAQVVFDAISEPNLVSWTSLLSGYCQCGESEKGLRIFLQSRRMGVKGNEFSWASVLGACAALEDLEVGKQVHSHVFKCGIGSDQFIAMGVINLYAKCGELDLARQAFLELDKPQLPSWTALIGGYAQQGQRQEAIDLFYKLHKSGLKPSAYTFSAIIGALSDAMAIAEGKQLHSLIIKSGFNSVTFVGNSVLDLYSKFRLLEESSKVFEEMNGRDAVSWNALICGHLKQGHFAEATELLDQMLLEGENPTPYTYSIILSTCGDLPATEWGKQTHGCIIKPGFDTDVVVGSSLIDMYAKCGRLNDAQKVFNNLTSKNLVSWNTMIVGYAQHGFGREALDIFDEMQRDGITPNDITFLGVLTACGHVGLVEEGWGHFNSMIRDHGIVPRIDHFTSMVSLFTRGGQIRRAYEFIMDMPMEPNKVVWRCLLAGCKTHKELTLARYAASEILRIDPQDVSAHIMLSGVYAEEEMWNETAKVRKVMKDKGLKKEPGCSWIEVKNKVHSFIADNNAHRHGDGVHEVVNGLTNQMFDAGYAPDAMFPLPYVK